MTVCIIVACNAALGVFKVDGNTTIISLESDGGNMKNSRQYKIQLLLRMAEITDDEEKNIIWMKLKNWCFMKCQKKPLKR